MKTVTFTEEKAVAIMNRLNLACLAGDLNVARHLVPIAEEFDVQLKAQVAAPLDAPTGPTL